MGELLILIIGLALLISGIHARLKYSPEKWKMATALVTLSKLTPHPGRYVTLYTPYVRYKYDVDGVDYEGDYYSYSSTEDLGTLEATGDILRQYSEGMEISIWYQVGNPTFSCIKLKSCRSRSEMSAFIVAGILIMTLAAAVLVIRRF